MVKLQTNFGDIVIELDHANTPTTADNFLKYAKNGFYDGTIFHRVINGFMIQGGGFEPGMSHKQPETAIENEAENAKPNLRGTVAMARTSEPHSASSQFFINVKDNNFLNFKTKSPEGYGYCVFGNVVSGMDVVDKIKEVATTARSGHQDVPTEDVIIKKVIIEE